MMVQCPSCKELVRLVEFTARDDVLAFHCAMCGASNRVQPGGTRPPAPASTPPAPAVEDNPPTSALHEPLPPPSSGSVPPLPAMPPPSSPPISVSPGTRDAALWAAWEKVHADWGNDRVHDTFIATCHAADALPFAGTRYKEHLLKRPEDPMAKRGRDRVLAQAIALAHSSRIERSVDDGGQGKNAMRMLLLVLAIGLAALMIRQVTQTRAALDAPMEAEE